MSQPLNATMTDAEHRAATLAADHPNGTTGADRRLSAARAAHPSQGRPRRLWAAPSSGPERGGPDEITAAAGLDARSHGDTARPVLRLVDEDGSLVTEYGLLAVVAATVAGVLIQWASGGALVSLFNALLSHARELVGA
ncbi:MAG: hypothetical protein ACLFRD_02305 [Nitriliruptoraceae bacterium]